MRVNNLSLCSRNIRSFWALLSFHNAQCSLHYHISSKLRQNSHPDSCLCGQLDLCMQCFHRNIYQLTESLVAYIPSYPRHGMMDTFPPSAIALEDPVLGCSLKYMEQFITSKFQWCSDMYLDHVITLEVCVLVCLVHNTDWELFVHHTTLCPYLCPSWVWAEDGTESPLTWCIPGRKKDTSHNATLVFLLYKASPKTSRSPKPQRDNFMYPHTHHNTTL